MRAVICDRYGPPEVLRLAEVATPSPASDEVLVRVQACAINPGDLILRQGTMRWLSGWRRPRQPVMGIDLAGTVAAVGPGVTAFQPGDRVYAVLPKGRQGALAEYCAVPVSSLGRMPGGCDAAEAAALPLGALTAWQSLRDHLALAPGQRLLVNGANGGIGVCAVALGRYLGAEVTAVARAEHHAGLRALGAEHCLTREQLPARGHFHGILDTNPQGHAGHWWPHLRADGGYVGCAPWLPTLWRWALSSLGARPRARFVMTRPEGARLNELATLVERGVLTPVVAARYPLDDVAAAQRYAQEHSLLGRVVVLMDQAGAASPRVAATAVDLTGEANHGR